MWPTTYACHLSVPSTTSSTSTTPHRPAFTYVVRRGETEGCGKDACAEPPEYGFLGHTSYCPFPVDSDPTRGPRPCPCVVFTQRSSFVAVGLFFVVLAMVGEATLRLCRSQLDSHPALRVVDPLAVRGPGTRSPTGDPGGEEGSPTGTAASTGTQGFQLRTRAARARAA